MLDRFKSLSVPVGLEFLPVGVVFDLLDRLYFVSIARFLAFGYLNFTDVHSVCDVYHSDMKSASPISAGFESPAADCSQLADALAGLPLLAQTNDGLGVRTWYTATWHWPASLILVFLLAFLLLVAVLYARERGAAGKKVRWLLAGVRLTLIGLVFLMIFGWHKNAALMTNRTWSS